MSQIHIHKNGERFGPFSADQINEKLLSGDLSITDLGWLQGMAAWEPLSAESFQSLGVTAPTEDDDATHPPSLGETTDSEAPESEYAQPETQSEVAGAVPIGSNVFEDLKSQDQTTPESGGNQNFTTPQEEEDLPAVEDEIMSTSQFRELLEETSKSIIPQLEEAAAEISKVLGQKDNPTKASSIQG